MTALSIENTLSPSRTTALNDAASNGTGQELGQADFIELLVAQVKNQDPSKPLEPSQFMNQIAQFSTVNGVTELKTAFDSLATKLTSDNSLRAADLVGRNVMVDGGVGYLASGDDITGQVDMTEHTSGLTLTIENSAGETVRTLSLGSKEAGAAHFSWNGTDDNGDPVVPGLYRIQATAITDEGPEAMTVSVETHVDSVSLNQEFEGLPSITLLNLETGERLPVNSVKQIS